MIAIKRGCVGKQTQSILKSYYQLALKYKGWKDPQVPNSDCWYGDKEDGDGDFVGVSMLDYYQPLAEEIFQVKLQPANSFCRLYSNGMVLDKHKDRKDIHYTATLPIWFDKEWPLNIGEKKVTLSVGDICFFQGTNVIHWRDAYDGNEHMDLFLHWKGGLND